MYHRSLGALRSKLVSGYETFKYCVKYHKYTPTIP